jgi:hypothetical protein
MDIKLTKPLAIFLLILTGPAVAQEEDQDPYRLLMSQPAISKFVQTFGSMVLSLPDDAEKIRPAIVRIWWASNAATDLTDEQRAESFELFGNQYENLVAATDTHVVTHLEIAGFAKIGSTRNLDIFYAGDSDQGPVMYRLSVSFRDQTNPWIYGIEVYSGFEDIREASKAIKISSGLRPLVVKKRPVNDQVE